jgi:hypothetical protein
MIYKEAFPSCSQTELGCAATSETAAKCERGESAEQSWWGNEPTGAENYYWRIFEQEGTNRWGKHQTERDYYRYSTHILLPYCTAHLHATTRASCLLLAT